MDKRAEVTELFKHLSDELDVSPSLVIEDLGGAGGAYSRSEDTVYLDPDQFSTPEDTAYVVAHELRHAYQQKHQPILGVISDIHRMVMPDSFSSYLFMPVEYDANAWATKWVKKQYQPRTVPEAITRYLEAGGEDATSTGAFKHAFWLTQHYYQREGVDLSGLTPDKESGVYTPFSLE